MASGKQRDKDGCEDTRTRGDDVRQCDVGCDLVDAPFPTPFHSVAHILLLCVACLKNVLGLHVRNSKKNDYDRNN